MGFPRTVRHVPSGTLIVGEILTLQDNLLGFLFPDRKSVPLNRGITTLEALAFCAGHLILTLASVAPAERRQNVAADLVGRAKELIVGDRMRPSFKFNEEATECTDFRLMQAKEIDPEVVTSLADRIQEFLFSPSDDGDSLEWRLRRRITIVQALAVTIGNINRMMVTRGPEGADDFTQRLTLEIQQEVATRMQTIIEDVVSGGLREEMG